MLSFSHAGMYTVETAHERATVDPNTIVLINASQEYRTAALPGRGPSGTSVAVRQDLLETLAPSRRFHTDYTRAYFGRLSKTCTPSTYLAERLLAARVGPLALKAPDSSHIALEETALDLVTAALADGHATVPEPRRSSRNRGQHHVHAIKAYLFNSIHRSVSLDEIARHVGLSPYYTSRLFHRETGMRMHKYLTSLRLLESLTHLDASERNLTHLALTLGFSHHSHFSAVFRREFGMTPSALRERM